MSQTRDPLVVGMQTRTRLINATDAEIASLLKQAAERIVTLLAQQPTDYQAWYLPRLYQQIAQALSRIATDAGQAASAGQRSVWNAGAKMVDDAVAHAPAIVRAVVPVIDDGQLRAMSSFLTEKISGITLEAANDINTQLGLVVMGGQTPFEAIKQVQQILGEQTLRRAKTIVHTELARAYSTATFLRLRAQAKVVPGLKKQWISSGKLHPREAHAMMNGQERDIDQPFDIPGGGQIMYPHDPSAPASETINCGCVMVPVVPGWKSTVQLEQTTDAEPVAKIMARQKKKKAA